MSKILLFVNQKENLRLLASYLGEHYEVLIGKSGEDLNRDFDLCILDGPMLERLWEQIETRKQATHSIFLPFLLVTHRKDVEMATRFLWKAIDELIITPVHKTELQARVESLLLARRLATIFPQTLVEHADIGVIVVDRHGIVRYWSPASERILGWKANEILGKPYPAVPAAEEAEYRETLRRLFRGERLSNVEVIRQKKDGTTIHLRFSATPLRDHRGIITHILSLITDITEYKQAEELAKRRFRNLQALRQIDTAITSGFDITKMLDTVLRHVVSELHVDAADILLLNPQTGFLEFAAGRGFQSEILQHTRLSPGEGFAGQVLRSREIIHVQDIAKSDNVSLNRAFHFSREDFVTYIGVPLIVKDEAIGVLEIFHRSVLDVNNEWLTLLETLAGQAAIAVNDARLYQDLQRAHANLALAYDETLEGWAAALDLRDKETEGHTRRVVELTLRLARAAGLSDEELIHIRRGAILHDIGKIGVPDSILLKPGPLTEEEWAIMRQHPQFAYNMLSPIEYLRPALDIPYCHHEKWDGSGYPRGLKGEQIPLAARLFAVVDVWDALRSDRPYRPAWPEEQAIEYIRSQAGKYFDPQVVELFLKMLEEGL